MKRWLPFAVVLLVCAGVCGGLDTSARRESRARHEELSARYRPSAVESSSDSPGASPVSGPDVAEIAPGAVDGPPPDPDGLFGPIFRMYGDCREDGVWDIRLSTQYAREIERDESLPVERRQKARELADMTEGMLDWGTPMGKIFAVCGMLGPDEPPFDPDKLAKMREAARRLGEKTPR